MMQPLAAIRTNILGTKNVIAAANESGARVVFLSSGAVFCGPRGTEYFEEQTPEPMNVYGMTKFLAEQAVQLQTFCQGTTVTQTGSLPGGFGFGGGIGMMLMANCLVLWLLSRKSLAGGLLLFSQAFCTLILKTLIMGDTTFLPARTSSAISGPSIGTRAISGEPDVFRLLI